MNTLKKKKKKEEEYKAYNGSGSPWTTGASYKNGGPKKRSLAKADDGKIVKNPKPMDQPKPNPYSLKDRPVIKDTPSVKPTSPIGSRPVPVGTNESKGPKTPMDVINKNTKKPGKIGQLVNRVKSNIQEKKEERQKIKDYKKTVKNNNGLSPYTAGASFKTGGMVNSNAKILADKTPGSKGTKVGLNKRVPKPGKKC